MNYQTLSFILLGIIGYASYSAYKLKDQIWCTFRRRDRTKIEKFASVRQTRIDFDDGWYEIDPSRVTLILWLKGIHALIPTWVRSLDFRHDSRVALSPDTFKNDWDTPEAKKALDKTHAVRQLFAGNRDALSGRGIKKNLIENYMPYILIIGFLAIGFLVWKQQGMIDLLGKGQNAMESMIGKLLTR